MQPLEVPDVTPVRGAVAVPGEVHDTSLSAAEQGRLIREQAFECINRSSRARGGRLVNRAVGLPG